MRQLPDGVIDVRKVKTVIGGEGGRAHLTWVVAYSDRIAPGTPPYETIREFVGTLKPPRNTEQSVMLLPVIAREPAPQPPAPTPPREKPPARTRKKARVKTSARAKARAKAPPKTRKKSPARSPLRKPVARKPARRASARKPARRSRR